MKYTAIYCLAALLAVVGVASPDAQSVSALPADNGDLALLALLHRNNSINRSKKEQKPAGREPVVFPPPLVTHAHRRCYTVVYLGGDPRLVALTALVLVWKSLRARASTGRYRLADLAPRLSSAVGGRTRRDLDEEEQYERLLEGGDGDSTHSMVSADAQELVLAAERAGSCGRTSEDHGGTAFPWSRFDTGSDDDNGGTASHRFTGTTSGAWARLDSDAEHSASEEEPMNGDGRDDYGYMSDDDNRSAVYAKPDERMSTSSHFELEEDSKNDSGTAA
ncbi:hypothetical protein THASP1DRAFT_23466 [Thamnocephalis sphaerospora]|uniref:Uncharacterized protein n=1 Tax=Thamnocephalis sphaerospora TaxID=78915 RepID=A0A4P9XT24_9FUNG|nr:hypothetical protein THASP1DRAFT_23466 [Thamnocephalis sphaerospora]|eukprot:RKP08560.1 hypothetical protein THASP1DRAFT_23466 [Thamnocephalis sphaerospora]